ncbi:MAG: hypothetical protein FJW40_15260, partial [Acidobacteria bacterium]|nr:hypothetical protein [Acidobacteriota bacterium]
CQCAPDRFVTGDELPLAGPVCASSREPALLKKLREANTGLIHSAFLQRTGEARMDGPFSPFGCSERRYAAAILPQISDRDTRGGSARVISSLSAASVWAAIRCREKSGLTRKEFELLAMLVENAGEIAPREVLLDRIWGYSHEIRTRTLDVHIRRLRKKLGRYGDLYIETIFGVGYRFQRFRQPRVFITGAPAVAMHAQA